MRFSFFKKHPLATLLILGFLLRAMLLFLDYSWDVNSHISWGKEAVTFGFPGFYERLTQERFSIDYPNYPPVPIYLFAVGYVKYQLLNKLAWSFNIAIPLFPSNLIFFIKSRAFLASLLKLPSVFADLGIAWMIYLFIKRLLPKKKNFPLVAASLILFNPAFFVNSSLWGQVEAIPIFFAAAAFYVVLFTKKYLWASVLFALSLLSKQTAVVFLPVFLIVVLKKYGWREVVESVSISFFVFFILFLPFYLRGNVVTFSFTTYFEKVLLVSGLPFVSNHAFNFWALITQWQNIPDMALFLGFPFRNLGYLATLAFILPVLYLLYRNPAAENVLFSLALVVFASFLFLTKIHERHFQQVLPFLIFFSLKDKKVFFVFLFLSLAHLANLYHNWSVPRIEPLVNFILSPITRNAFIAGILISFYFLFTKYIRDSRVPNGRL
ncbi:DUF2029 domain-containing protein [Candidatus Roizmanbacteria bacterium]|nr:DUF2029 domain-containing protein [Candidatus Roizmanbacteria bacterium]